ncbi:hypothetical protein HKX42_03430 [Salinisphaera sp. USBA-960]|uniref:hypothetical protein n=1 Tax=Salinisphaera orenii TaxID=856731 RepID=UPI0013A5F5B1|nr:hypothetical protein [Salifodinibacter halophilus]
MIRNRPHVGGALCVSDKMITPFSNQAERRDHRLAHQLRYIHDTLVNAGLAHITRDEAELVQLCHRNDPSMLYNALAS